MDPIGGKPDPYAMGLSSLLTGRTLSSEQKNAAQMLGKYPGYEQYNPEGRAAITTFNKIMEANKDKPFQDAYRVAYRGALDAYMSAITGAVQQTVNNQIGGGLMQVE